MRSTLAASFFAAALALSAIAFAGCSSSGPNVADAGSDAGPVAGSDAGPVAGSDAGPDAGSDAGPDAGSDGGPLPGQCFTAANCTALGTEGTYCAGGDCGCIDNLFCADPADSFCTLLEEGQCQPCAKNADCNSSLGGPICNSGTCTGCTSNNDCATSDFGGFCNTSSGICGCSSVSDCTAARAGPSCITINAGGATSVSICGCSAATDTCPRNAMGEVCNNVLDRWKKNIYICSP